MTQLMVAFFNNNAKSIAALKKLQDLESYGILTVYDKMIVHKKAGAGFEMVNEKSTAELSAATAVAEGALLGNVAGPVGCIAAVLAGRPIGVQTGLNHYNFAPSFITLVEEKMLEDSIAVIVETDALTDEFIAVYVKPFDAIVVKTCIGYPDSNYLSNEMEENQTAIELAVRELKKGKNRQIIQTQIVSLKERRQNTFASFETACAGRWPLTGI